VTEIIYAATVEDIIPAWLASSTPAASSPTVFFSHTAPAPASSHQPVNSIFLSHHSSHQLQLQLQPSEQSEIVQELLFIQSILVSLTD